MIDHRFSLRQHTENKHLYHLLFRVDMPLDRNYKKHETHAIITVCKQQYPELLFSDTGLYTAKFPDGQYASGTIERTFSAHTDLAYVKSILFSLPLNLDTVMEKCLSFKQYVPPLIYTAHPDFLLNVIQEDLLEIFENLYKEQDIHITIREVSWEPTGKPFEYFVKPTDYDV